MALPSKQRKYNPELALAIVEEVASGTLLRDVLRRRHMPTRSTWFRWLMTYPELGKAYTAALVLSAAAMEEEALALGREIVTGHEDGTQVRAYEVAMNQLRWSASKRDPGRFGERMPVSVRVPIQINTTLDLGSEGAGGTLEHPNIYGLTASVAANPQLPAPQENNRGPAEEVPQSEDGSN